MICWREKYKEDLRASNLIDRNFFERIRDRRFRFYRSLRITEFYSNKNDFFSKIFSKFLRYKHYLLCQKYGWLIPINVFGPGLAIVHVGPIIVSNACKIGKNCRINAMVNIGNAESNQGIGAPQLGDNIYIGPGAKLYGPICLGNNIAIGANAVVNKSFEGNCTIAGVPAKIVSKKNSSRFIYE